MEIIDIELPARPLKIRRFGRYSFLFHELMVLLLFCLVYYIGKGNFQTFRDIYDDYQARHTATPLAQATVSSERKSGIFSTEYRYTVHYKGISIEGNFSYLSRMADNGRDVQAIRLTDARGSRITIDHAIETLTRRVFYAIGGLCCILLFLLTPALMFFINLRRQRILAGALNRRGAYPWRLTVVDVLELGGIVYFPSIHGTPRRVVLAFDRNHSLPWWYVENDAMPLTLLAEYDKDLNIEDPLKDSPAIIRRAVKNHLPVKRILAFAPKDGSETVPFDTELSNIGRLKRAERKALIAALADIAAAYSTNVYKGLP